MLPEQSISDTGLPDQTATMWYRRTAQGLSTITHVTPDCISLTGYSAEELLNQPYAELIHPDDRQSYLQKISQCLLPSNVFNGRYRIRTRTGTHFWVNETCRGVFDTKGNLMHMEGFVKGPDSSVQPVFNRAFEAYGELLLHESIVTITDYDGNILFANDRFCTLSGFTPDELTGHNHNIINSGFHPPTFFEHMWATIKSGQIWKGEVKNRNKSGETYWVDTLIAPVTDENGTIFQFISIRNVITEKKELLSRIGDIAGNLQAAVFQFKRDSEGAFSFPYLSPNIIHFLGVSAEAVYADANQALIYIHPADAYNLMQSIEVANENFQTWNFIFRTEVKGTQRWISGQAVPKLMENGEILWNGTLSDITSQKSLEAEYYQVSDQLKHIFDLQQECFLGLDLVNQKTIYISPGCQYISGYDTSVFYANPMFWYEMVLPEELEPIRNRLRNELKPEEPLTLEFRIRHKDGSLRWLECTISGTFNTIEKPYRVDAILTNIDARKKQEAELQQKNAMLKEAQRIARVGSWELQTSDYMLRWSRTLDEILEWKTENTKHSMADFFEVVHEEDRNLVQEAFRMAIEENKTYNIVHRLQLSDNRIRHVRQKCDTVTNEGGKVIRLVGTIQDISATVASSELRENLLRELTIKNEALERKNQEMDRMVYSTTHDLRAPLQSLKGIIGLLDDMRDSDAAFEEMKEMMLQTINRCDNTIRGILDFSKNTKIEISTELLNMQQLIQECIENIQYMDMASKVQFVVNVQPGASLHSDAFRIRTLLNNLISNAVKYQRAEEPEKRVWIDVTHVAENCVISIRDNGEGIPEDKISAITSPFVRNSQSKFGTGLGLFFCQDIVNRLGGEMRIESHTGQGSLFQIILQHTPPPMPYPNETHFAN